MRKQLRKLIQKLSYSLHHEEGAAIVEFSIIAPLFIFCIFAVIQLSIVAIIDNALETAVREGARYGITGQGAGARESEIRRRIQTTAQDYSGGLIDPSKLMITINSYSTLQVLEANTNSVSNSGTGSQAVKYQVQYTWDTIFPIFGSSKDVVLKAQTPVLNEGF